MITITWIVIVLPGLMIIPDLSLSERNKFEKTMPWQQV